MDFLPRLKHIVVLSVCVCVLLFTYLALVRPSKKSITRPKIASIPLLGLPNTVLKRAEEQRIDPWSHTSALPPAKKPGFHIPPSQEPESRMTTGIPSEKPKFYGPTAALLPEPSSQSGPNYPTARSQSRNKVILIWTSWNYQYKIWHGLPEGLLSCAQYNMNVSCKITYNRTEYEHSDMVAFHGYGKGLDSKDLPDLTKRLPHQRWVYYNHESPARTSPMNNPSQGKIFNGLFNWTITYKLDSDIYHPYGRIIPGESSYEPNTLIGEIAVAVISNWQRQRLTYIKELKKYIPVHVYGRCGTYKCPNRKWNDKACFDFLKGKYRFYLAFENSVCKEYVTEKLYLNALQHNLLPVVINAANMSDATVAPPGCCIKASDFKGARELAEYIRMVASNSTLYSNYFKWRSRYKVQGTEPLTKVFCRACHKLNTDSEMKVYHNFHSWYGSKTNCFPYPKP